MSEQRVHRISLRVKHYRDSPWREYLILGAPDGRWSGVGEGDYYIDPTDWSDIVGWIADNYAWEGLTILAEGRPVTLDELTKAIRTP